MLLENKYYQIKEMKMNQQEGIFRLRLLPDCDIYRGHFPSNPVCPGVCHKGMCHASDGEKTIYSFYQAMPFPCNGRSVYLSGS